MPINNSYNEEAIVKAIATALDSFYTNLIGNIDKLNIKKVMKRKNPYLFRAKAMNGAAQIIDAILAALVSSLSRLPPQPHRGRKHWRKVWILWWNGITPSMPSL